MSKDLNDFDQKIQQQLDKLSGNLERFSTLQVKAEHSKDAFDRASKALKALESESRARLDKYDNQFNTVLHEVNLRMEELSFLRDKLTGAQRDFTAFADKRIEDHKETVDIQVSNLHNDIKSLNQGLELVDSNIDNLSNSLESPDGIIKRLEKRVRVLAIISIVSLAISIILLIVHLY